MKWEYSKCLLTSLHQICVATLLSVVVPNLILHKDVNNTNGVLCNQQVKEYTIMQYFGTTRPVHPMLTYILIQTECFLEFPLKIAFYGLFQNVKKSELGTLDAQLPTDNFYTIVTTVVAGQSVYKYDTTHYSDSSPQGHTVASFANYTNIYSRAFSIPLKLNEHIALLLLESIAV